MAIRTDENPRPKAAHRAPTALALGATILALLLAGVAYLAVCTHPVYVGPYVLLGPRCVTSVQMQNAKMTMAIGPGKRLEYYAPLIKLKSPAGPEWDPRMKLNRTWIFGRFAVIRLSDK